jgi:type II secretory pathway predicted ATPase ExeA
MLLRYFGFSGEPFGVTPDPRFLYPSNTHREALASLKYGLYSNRGFTALIAPPGLGKTTILYRYLADIRESARSVFLFDVGSHWEPGELISAILRDLGITPAETSTETHEQMNAVLVEESRAGRMVVVVIDEAQNLSDAALETLRLLSNFETAGAKLIHIVLAGQPQLSDKLMAPTLVQLRQRITTICNIEPLSAEEARAYINHRLQLAGYRGEPLFANDALHRIIEAGQGIPRLLNNLCFNSLSICRALNGKQVTGGMVEEAVTDLRLVPYSERVVAAVPAQPRLIPSREGFKPLPLAGLARRWVRAIPAVLIVAMLAVLAFSKNQIIGTHAAIAVQPVEQKAMPNPGSVAGATQSDKSTPAPAVASVEPFEVKVANHQTLRDIAVQYLGEFNAERLRQIRALNPAMTNPDHIEPKQSIWLPGPPAPHAAGSAMTSTDTRGLP